MRYRALEPAAPPKRVRNRPMSRHLVAPRHEDTRRRLSRMAHRPADGTPLVTLAGCFGVAAVRGAALTLSWSQTLRPAITMEVVGVGCHRNCEFVS